MSVHATLLTTIRQSLGRHPHVMPPNYGLLRLDHGIFKAIAALDERIGRNKR